MSVRLATQDDADRLDGFLLLHADGSMFPLSNLRRHGLGTSDHPRAMEFWIEESIGAISGVVGVSKEGYAFPQAPRSAANLGAAVREAIAGRKLRGIIGPTVQAHDLRTALGLGQAPMVLENDEPQYALNLADLEVPGDSEFSLIQFLEDHRTLLIAWRSAYLEEVMNQAPEVAATNAKADATGYLEADSHRLLMRDHKPVSMTGFNAALPEIVQIGGVYTPPELRRQGLARAAVARHLDEARSKGAHRAVLFASSPKAARAYEAIGFRRIGEFSLLIFDGPQQVRPCPA